MSDLVEELGRRADLLTAARAFFEQRGVMEVDVPALNFYAPVDLHIDLFSTVGLDGATRYLHSSPEQGMKRLLSLGVGDCYQLSHVFRDDPTGPLHRCEFTMAEWYRIGFSQQEMIDETVAFASLFCEMEGVDQMSYHRALHQYASVDWQSGDLRGCLAHHGIECDLDLSRDDLLSLVVGCVVEPALPKRRWTVITDFPASQAALAKIEGECAQRFELYGGGMELANGYVELTDADEQERRFRQANQQRIDLGKEALPLDQTLLGALRRGLPECCGVAVGFDRLMLLALGKSEFEEM